MGEKVVIRRCFDLELILAVVHSMPEAYEDNTLDDYAPDVMKEWWLACHADEEFCGLFRINCNTSQCIECHALLLKDKRKHSKKIGKQAARYILDNIDFRKMVSHAAECYPNVIAYLEWAGMKEQGYNSDAWQKDGQIYGVSQYGITREDLEKWAV